MKLCVYRVSCIETVSVPKIDTPKPQRESVHSNWTRLRVVFRDQRHETSRVVIPTERRVSCLVSRVTSALAPTRRPVLRHFRPRTMATGVSLLPCLTLLPAQLTCVLVSQFSQYGDHFTTHLGGKAVIVSNFGASRALAQAARAQIPSAHRSRCSLDVSRASRFARPVVSELSQCLRACR